MNPTTSFFPGTTKNGIFDTSSSQTLYLFIDIKTPIAETWPAVLSALEPLRSGNWLTTYDGKTRTSAPITVVGTGNTQLSYVQNYLPRDVFFDAPLAQLSTADYANLTVNESPIASTDFAASFGSVRGTTLNDTQMGLLREQVGVASKKGIMARYWDQPGWPIGTRNAIWRILWDEGVGLVNVSTLR